MISNLEFTLEFRGQLLVEDNKLVIFLDGKKELLVQDLENDFETGILDPIDLFEETELVEIDDRTGRYDFSYDFEQRKIGFIYSNFTYQQFLNAIEGKKSKDIASVVKQFVDGKTSDTLKLLPKVGSYLHMITLKPIVLEEFSKKILNFNRDQLPVLIHKHISTDETPLDVAMRNNQIKSIAMLLDLLIKFQCNPYFNSIVDKHLCTLIEKGIDLKDYFDSTLPIFQIKNEEYPSLHEDDTTKIYAVNVDK